MVSCTAPALKTGLVVISVIAQGVTRVIVIESVAPGTGLNAKSSPARASTFTPGASGTSSAAIVKTLLPENSAGTGAPFIETLVTASGATPVIDVANSAG